VKELERVATVLRFPAVEIGANVGGNDLDDASLALARLLCSGTEDLGRKAGWNAAIGRLHPGDAYARSVFEAANSYGQRTRDIG